MKNINKGLGYLAVAAISIAIVGFTGSVLGAVAVALIGFMVLDD